MSPYGAPGWVLAIDFGTSNTSASWRDHAGQVRELRLGSGGNLMPSAVLAGPDKIVVGEVATRTAQTDPAAFEPAPKRRLPEGTVLLGGRSVTATSLVAAVFAEVLRLASRVAGHPPAEVIVTHPDRWDEALKSQLFQSAVEGGIPPDRIRLLTEARAAAWFYTGWGTPPAVGELIAVFDFGAGTCDVAVLKKEHDGSFTLLAAEGVDGLGGRDLDGRIWRWVRRELTAAHPELLAELDSPAGLRGKLMLMDRIREAKETLSELSTAAIAVPGRDRDAVLTLTRGEFETLIAADIAEAVALTQRVFTLTGVPDYLYLTGGSSLIPLVHAELGKVAPVAELGDPQTVVSQGALRAPSSQARPRQPSPATEAPVHHAPIPVAPIPAAAQSSRSGKAAKTFLVAFGVVLGVVVLAGIGFGINGSGDQAEAVDSKTTTSGATTSAGSTTAAQASGTAGCDGLSSNECGIVQAFSSTVRQTYDCQSGSEDLAGIELSSTASQVLCLRNDTATADWPEVIAVVRASKDADVEELFNLNHQKALKVVPESAAWPAPTSTSKWGRGGQPAGDMLSMRWSDGGNRFVWTEEKRQAVVTAADGKMSNQGLYDWFLDTTIWAAA